MKFSDRIGITSPSKQLQVDSIDEDLMNGLWNTFQIKIIERIKGMGSSGLGSYYFKIFYKALWHDFFKLPIDTVPDSYDAERSIRKWFFDAQWFDVYNFMEYIANLHIENINLNNSDFISFCNGILRREFSGYQFISGKISPITNEHEIAEIESALSKSNSLTSLEGANIHLKTALSMLSDKMKPDYRNSIKESITAIESVAKVISKDPKDTLGTALEKIKNPLNLHPAQVSGYKAIYGYTSDASGIRHALMEAPTCDFEDAKYMLVSSSAFINYLLTKAHSVGIQLT